jgi:proteasome lid subunit RPN8/RPN11
MLKHAVLDLSHHPLACQEIVKQAEGSPVCLVPAIVNKAGQMIADARHVQKEVCGVICLGEDGQWIATQLPNHSDDPLFFSLGDEFEKYRDKAIAIYHSHHGEDVSGELSDADIANSFECGIPYLSYHVDFKVWDYFDPDALHPFPLELDPSLTPDNPKYYDRWRFRYGRSDCWRVIRSWYAGVLGVEAGDHARVALTPIHLQFSAERARAQGFTPHPKTETIADHDVILFDAFQGRANHVGVIIDATRNLMLHSIGYDHYSIIENFDQSWRDKARTIYRHREVAHD